jgi:hypothetical protein
MQNAMATIAVMFATVATVACSKVAPVAVAPVAPQPPPVPVCKSAEANINEMDTLFADSECTTAKYMVVAIPDTDTVTVSDKGGTKNIPRDEAKAMFVKK